MAAKSTRPTSGHPEDERSLPRNLDAERAVLGSILLHSEAFDVAARFLTPEDFYRAAHQKLFAAMRRLMSVRHGAVDLTMIREELTRVGELDSVGGPAYITSLVDGLPRSTNVASYARIVKDKALLRGLISVGNQIVSGAYAAEEGPAVLFGQADRALVTLQHGAGSDRMQSLAQTSAGLMDNLQYRLDHKGELTGVPSGFTSIDELTIGWQAGDLIVVAARPSVGKTAWALNTVMAASGSVRRDGQRRRVAVFSLEMRRQQLEYRILSSLSGIQLSRILNGFIYGPEEWQKLSQAMLQMQEADVYIDDTSGRTTWEIRAECRRLRAERGLDLVVIDYVQLMAGSLDRRGANRNEEVTDISRKLKTLADELACPIILLSQLNRAAADRADPRPKLTDLRESGALEQDADIVAFLHRKHHREGGVTNFILEKQRNGPCGTVNLTLDRDTVTFTDGGEEPAPPEPTEEEKAAKKQSAIRRRYARGSR